MFRFLSVLAVSLILFASCGGDSPNDNHEQVVEKQYLVLSSQSIANESEVESSKIKELVLSYNKMISLSNTGSVKVNGIESQVSVSGTSATIQLNLTEGSTYKVVIPEGTFTGKIDNNTISPAFSLTFTTKAAAKADKSKIAKSLTNSNATKEARNVYDFLLQQYGEKTLSGVQSGMSNTNDYVNAVGDNIGKHPALAGYDFLYLNFSPTPANWSWQQNYNDISAQKEQWANNGLVCYMWHWNVPNSEVDFNNCVEKNSTENMGFYCPGSGNGNGETSFDIREALKDGTWQNKCILRDIEELAGYIKNLQDANIPILFRPLHEAAGNYTKYNKNGGSWFWWGRYGAEYCKKLYQLLHDQLTIKYGLNNIIWVWTIDVLEGYESSAKEWYPGNEYVDIVGFDVYTKNESNDHLKAQKDKFDFLTAVTDGTKITTISECGNMIEPSAQKENSIYWSWFMVWSSKDADGNINISGYPKNTKDYWSSVINNKYVINREDMPSLK